MSATAAKAGKHELANLQRLARDGVLNERDRCAKLAEGIRDRALRDGMVAAAHTADEISKLIRGGAR